MTPDDEILLEADGGSIEVVGPDDVVDDVAATLAADKDTLLAVVDVFGPVTVVSAGTPAVWPPKGGFVPAWRRVSSTRPLVVLPDETVPVVVDPLTLEAPTVQCLACKGTAWHRAGSGWSCRRCHPPVPADDREVCAICGGKGGCRPDHVARLRQFGEQLLRRTRSAAKREAIQAALAALPEDDAHRAPETAAAGSVKAEVATEPCGFFADASSGTSS